MARPVPHVTHVNVNPAGGVPKHAVPSAWVGAGGVEGDRQRNLKYHGGPMRAVCLYSLHRIEAFQLEGHPIQPGSIGENLTVAGLDWDVVQPDVQFAIGDEAMVQITTFAVPCKNIAYAFADRDPSRVSDQDNRGWARAYAKILREGIVRPGDVVRLVDG